MERPKRIKKLIIYTEFDGESDTDIAVEDMECIKRDAHEVLDHTCSNIERQPDRSIVITPVFRQLPTEIVFTIINHVAAQTDLYQCTLVNKQFNSAANATLWQYPNLDNQATLYRYLICQSNATQQQPKMDHPYIKKLNLDSDHWTDMHFGLLMQHLHHLQQLEIGDRKTKTNNTQITDTGVQHIPYHCRRLTSLSLFDLSPSPPFFDTLGQYCHHLRHLTLLSPRLPSGAFDRLAMCPLESLEIGSKNEIEMDENTLLGITTLDRLKRLVVAGLDSSLVASLLKAATPPINNNNNNNNKQPPLDGDHGIKTPWPCLTHLHLEDCVWIKDKMVIAFVESHPHLQDLRLWYAPKLTNACLDVFPVALPHLTHLDLEGVHDITPIGVRRMIRACPRLVWARFDDCEHLFPMEFPECPMHQQYIDYVNDDRSSTSDASQNEGYDYRVELDRVAMETIRQAQGDQENNVS